MPRKPGEPLKYKEIADDLRGRIRAGEFPAGQKLPPERELAKVYAIAQGTMRQALTVLRNEGIVTSRVGSGWTVVEWRPIVRNGLGRLKSDQWGAGKSIWDVDVEDRDLAPEDITIQHLPADASVATALGLDEGDLVWRRDRRYRLDGVLVLRSTEHFPDDLARGTRITQTDTGPGGVYKRLEEAGHKPVGFQEDLHFRKASPAEAQDLSLAVGAPVVELVRYARDASSRVVAVNRMILDASRYIFRYEFSA
ncbi:GntR family transcriptional regulator [Streptomyces sp. NPDC002994]|uniref:GntR family transcriptional regulator n=1 Tax=Streptomyces sp. NPDC002994 TaxID=3154441 RepID=UPI0033AAA716